MVVRQPKVVAVPENAPRAKALRPRTPEALPPVSTSIAAALKAFATETVVFDLACEERAPTGQVDDRYARLARAAADLIGAVHAEPAWADPLASILGADRRDPITPGQDPESDIRAAQVLLARLS